MAAGEEVTVPEPVPDLDKESVFAPGGSVLKTAVTLRLEVMVTLQLPEPAQSPDQRINSEPPAGLAVKLTLAPSV